MLFPNFIGHVQSGYKRDVNGKVSESNCYEFVKKWSSVWNTVEYETPMQDSIAIEWQIVPSNRGKAASDSTRKREIFGTIS